MRLDAQLAADQRRTLPHARQPERGPPDDLRVEPAAVVTDDQDETPVLHGGPHPDDGRVRMAPHVVERLLRDPQRLRLGPGRQPGKVGLRLELGAQAEAVRELVHGPRHHLGERARRRRRQAQGGHGLLGLDESRVDRLAQLIGQGVALRPEARQGGQAPRLQLGQPQVLRQPVMELPGESGALLERGALELDGLEL